jgi:hypothetical protein
MLLNDMHTDWDNSDSDTRDSNIVLHTDGSGYWTEEQKAVRITNLTLGYISEEKEFGELRVHFNTDDWRCDKNGLIYTDRQFMKELCVVLNELGLVGEDVSYSEQGMQGDNYVSCDIGEKFIASWERIHGEVDVS